MKKFLLSFLIMFNICLIDVSAISAKSAIVLDATSGRVLYEHNATEKRGMASTTKIITAITALENADLSSIVTASPSACGIEGSSMYLVNGEKLTLEEILYGLMLVSGNDAATAIAEHISGSADKFAELMNKKAAEIGAFNSNFTNPHGLSDDMHYTTAYDLAKITAYGLKNPKFTEIVSTKTKSIPWKDHNYNRKLVNHNKFLNMYEGCIGVKTGFTKATGRCLVTAVEKENMRLICVTLNASDDWNDHTFLYNSAFENFYPYLVKEKNDVITEVKINNGATDTVNLICPEDIFIPVKSGEENNIEIVSEAFEDIQAPIYQGDILGKLYVKINGKICGEFPLCAAENVDLKKIIFKAVKGDWGIMLRKVFYLWLTCLI